MLLCLRGIWILATHEENGAALMHLAVSFDSLACLTDKRTPVGAAPSTVIHHCALSDWSRKNIHLPSCSLYSAHFYHQDCLDSV